MANQEFRETLRVALSEFDSFHLHKVMVAAYDRWNWETGSEHDKDWFEVAEELLKERGVEFNMSGNGGTVNISGGPTDVVIAADKLKVQQCGGGIDHEVFQMSGGVFEFGFDMKAALVKALGDELTFGSLTTNQGRNLRDIIKEAALEAMRERL